MAVILLFLLLLESTGVDASWPRRRARASRVLRKRIARTLIVVYKPNATDEAIAHARQQLSSGVLNAQLATGGVSAIAGDAILSDRNSGSGSDGGDDGPLQFEDMLVDVFESETSLHRRGPAAALIDALTSLRDSAASASGPQDGTSHADGTLIFDGGARAQDADDDGRLVAAVSKAAADNGVDSNLTRLLSEARALRSRDSPVAYVERDRVLHLQQADRLSFLAVQYNDTLRSWGLDRIDQQDSPALDMQYSYFEAAGEGVDVYVIDSGIDDTHPEFEGRATLLRDYTDEGLSDELGHGTHVAGTIAGHTTGVAKQANIIALKVCDEKGACTGAGILTSIYLAIKRCKAGKGRRSSRRCVINMSLNGDRWMLLDYASIKAVAGGIVVVASAGNDGGDACGCSPGGVDAVLTVGASNANDFKASFSNQGPCVNVYAPGVKIYSAMPGGRYALRQGTSMAAPHVAGTAALLWSAFPSLSSDEVISTIKDGATHGVISLKPSGTPGPLLFSLARPTTGM